MQAVFYLVLLVVYTTAGPVDITDGTHPRFIEFPDDEGKLHIVDLEAKPDGELLEEIARNPADNEYYLFTRRNPRVPQRLIQNTLSIRVSNYNARNPTIVVVHGWWGSLNSPSNLLIRDVYFDRGDVNVIVLDWSRHSMLDYTLAARAVPAIGRGLGQFLNFLSSVTGAPLNTFHLIGFSLGAHLVGNAGRQLNGKVARVTGLDPAGTLWDQNPNRLTSDDGVYVEGIHTNAGPNGLGIGLLTTVGHADFFPNGGMFQPGCDNIACHHDRSWQQFAASVTYNHLVGSRCANTAEAVTDSCHGSSFNMGNADLNKWGFGLYRVNTGSEHPF